MGVKSPFYTAHLSLISIRAKLISAAKIFCIFLSTDKLKRNFLVWIELDTVSPFYSLSAGVKCSSQMMKYSYSVQEVEWVCSAVALNSLRDSETLQQMVKSGSCLRTRHWGQQSSVGPNTVSFYFYKLDLGPAGQDSRLVTQRTSWRNEWAAVFPSSARHNALEQGTEAWTIPVWIAQ